jgi:proline iminopeptidase
LRFALLAPFHALPDDVHTFVGGAYQRVDKFGGGVLDRHGISVTMGCDNIVPMAVGWYEQAGSGPPLVLCHGGPGMWDYLEPLALLIDDLATVVRYDQRGSERGPAGGPFTVAQFIADLDELRAELGFGTWIVGGHSWGAMLALHYAFAHPQRTEAIVYLSGVGIGREWNAAYHAEADRRRSPEQNARLQALSQIDWTPEQEREWRILNWLPDYATDGEARAAELASSPFHLNREVNRALNAETKRWREAELARQAAELTMPVLLVHGMLDPRPHWAIDSLADALPNATVCKLPDAGHLTWVEAPDETTATIRTFVRDL